jgi:hypothetical protein
VGRWSSVAVTRVFRVMRMALARSPSALGRKNRREPRSGRVVDRCERARRVGADDHRAAGQLAGRAGSWRLRLGGTWHGTGVAEQVSQTSMFHRAGPGPLPIRSRGEPAGSPTGSHHEKTLGLAPHPDPDLLGGCSRAAETGRESRCRRWVEACRSQRASLVNDSNACMTTSVISSTSLIRRRIRPAGATDPLGRGDQQVRGRRLRPRRRTRCSTCTTPAGRPCRR